MHKFLEPAELFHKMSICGPNFSFFTTVIVISFEVDYLLNRWSYRNTGVTLGHNFLFPATFITGKIDPTSGYGDRKHQKSW